METSILKSLKDSVKNWWTSLILGILFIIMAVWIMMTPLESYLALSVFLGVLMFISGIMEIIFSIGNRKTLDGWGWQLTSGVLDFILGAILVSYPQITMVVLPIFIAFWILFKGVAGISFSIDLKSYGIKGWWMLLGICVIVCLFAISIFIEPLIGGFGIVYMTAFGFLFAGIFRIGLALKLQKLNKTLHNKE